MAFMLSKYDTEQKKRQEGQGLSQELLKQLETHLNPLLVWLDTMLDKRLVKTLLLSIVAIIQFRNPTQGLLLSELGAYITNPSQAPAGTKRVSNLLRSEKWSASHLEEYIASIGERKEKKKKRSYSGSQVFMEKSCCISLIVGMQEHPGCKNC